MSLTSNTILSCRVLSFPIRSLIVPSAGSTGTDVNRAVTSYELRHSPGSNVTLSVQQVLGAMDVLWGLTNKWFKVFVSTLATP